MKKKIEPKETGPPRNKNQQVSSQIINKGNKHMLKIITTETTNQSDSNENQVVCWTCYANTKKHTNSCHHIKESELCMTNLTNLNDYKAHLKTKHKISANVVEKINGFRRIYENLLDL